VPRKQLGEQHEQPPLRASTASTPPTHRQLLARHLVGEGPWNFTDFSGAITIGDTFESSSVVAESRLRDHDRNRDARQYIQRADFLDQEISPRQPQVDQDSARAGQVRTPRRPHRQGSPSLTSNSVPGHGPSMTRGQRDGFECIGRDDRVTSGQLRRNIGKTSLIVGNKIANRDRVEPTRSA